MPIVGGSILSHDHYQAGRYEFAMTRAEGAFSFQIKQHPAIEASVLKWPMSVIRLKGTAINSLVEAADHIFRLGKLLGSTSGYLGFTDGTPHNTITPIARNVSGVYEIDLVLRNNRTSAEHPYGIFHPHADVHHIKKENIGLIEVMGLAVLPPRLKTELAAVKEFLLGQSDAVEAHHREWAEQLKPNTERCPNRSRLNQLYEKNLARNLSKPLRTPEYSKTAKLSCALSAQSIIRGKASPVLNRRKISLFSTGSNSSASSNETAP
ncbi:hypothetical protein PO124_02235 [Bacillus licheniformis]|nr:hypothetical protein [Bacillus licheniformis]